VTGEFVRLEPGAVARLTLQAPRANALEPELLAALHGALDRLEAEMPEAVVLTGGRNFCSGGDVARFHAAAEAGKARAYAAEVVPELQRALLRLLALPALVILAARGAVTGGGAGFLFSADLAVLSPDAFVQPYYARMGFAPDGGWTALLPERIGAARAMSWLIEDRREDAAGLRALGLASVHDEPERVASERLAEADTGTLRSAKALIWDADRRTALSARLQAETEAFLDRIDQPEVARRMAAFMKRPEWADV
jgi:2-(1,2-epoxy-1,2-dihydrophenyl)acetyl-CoA isomerase